MLEVKKELLESEKRNESLVEKTFFNFKDSIADPDLYYISDEAFPMNVKEFKPLEHGLDHIALFLEQWKEVVFFETEKVLETNKLNTISILIGKKDVINDVYYSDLLKTNPYYNVGFLKAPSGNFEMTYVNEKHNISKMLNFPLENESIGIFTRVYDDDFNIIAYFFRLEIEEDDLEYVWIYEEVLDWFFDIEYTVSLENQFD